MMKLHKIIDSVIPTMWNRPCRIAIFTDGVRCKVFQRDVGFWWRNTNLERYRTVHEIEQQVCRINECGRRLEDAARRWRIVNQSND